MKDPGFQHVYITVPRDGNKSSLNRPGNTIVIDPVVDRFNYEVPFSDKYDRFMSLGNSLNGLGEPQNGCGAKTRKNVYPTDVMRVRYIEENGQVVTEKFLTENGIPFTVSNYDDGSVRYNVETKRAESLAIPPVIGKEDAKDYLAKINAPPIVTPTTTTNAGIPKALYVLGVLVCGALLLGGGSKNKKESSSLSGPVAQKTPAKRKVKKLKTIHIH